MNLKDGYGQSKAVSEQLLYEANRLGLDVTIFRPSAISAHRTLNHVNTLDFGNLLLRTCFLLQAAPLNIINLLSWIPVDFVADAIVRLSKPGVTNRRVFNLVGPNLQLKQVIEELPNCGIVASLDCISIPTWKKRIEETIQPNDRILYPIREQLRSFPWKLSDESNSQTTTIDPPIKFTRLSLKNLDIDWTDTSSIDYIRHNLNCLKSHNFFQT
jgi:thioester reductase-like protein